MANKKILVIYTGGTFGMKREQNGNSSLNPAPLTKKDIETYIPQIKELPFEFELNTEIKPIDSTDMTPDLMTRIAGKIRDNYDSYDGFVVLHGTDTMAYTASLLSFVLQNLAKPVILTGAQLPLYDKGSDGVRNFINALCIAAAFGTPLIPEVCVCFGDVLLRGNRCVKVSTESFRGFESPNFPPVAEIGERITVNPNYVSPHVSGDFHIVEKFDTNVMVVSMFPGITYKTLKSIFKSETLRGVVLRSYGAGNIPTDKKILDVFDRAKKRGIVIVNVTQCLEGAVMPGLYETGAGLEKHGIYSGGDMTTEAALAKLMFLLGQGKADYVRDKITANISGEMSE
ncbi:L-asparaginase 1 [Clostridia bacterium]|nr:L-asparaginase 1 [Clostridia bacterium]